MRKYVGQLKKLRREFLSRHTLLYRLFPKLMKRWLPKWQKPRQTESGFHSQHGQDRWVIDRVFPASPNDRFFIEMGAGDGLLLSNTTVLEKQYGWTGILIEPTDKFEKLRENRGATCVHTCLSDKEGKLFIAKLPSPGYLDEDGTNTLRSMVISADSLKEAEREVKEIVPPKVLNSMADNRLKLEILEVPCMTLESVLIEANAPKTIDYLSLDVEGHEYEAMLGFPFDRYKILSMNIERPNKRLLRLLFSRHYLPVARNSVGDVFFVHRDISESYFSYTKGGVF